MEKEEGKYWVMGGHYTGTDFKTIVSGKKLEEHGPFDTHEEAVEKWQELTWRTVDICSQRYMIKVTVELDLPNDLIEYVTQSAKDRNMTIDTFIEEVLEHAIKDYKEKYPYTREDIMEISE